MKEQACHCDPRVEALCKALVAAKQEPPCVENYSMLETQISEWLDEGED